MSRRLRATSSQDSLLGRYGPGNDGNRRERGRWIVLQNNSAYDMFLGERTQGERTSIYDNFPQPKFREGNGNNLGYNPGPVYGYTPYRRLYNNRAQIGNGPCWNGNSNRANYRSPPGCEGGMSQEGITNTNNVNPLQQNARNGVHHFDGSWMFYFEKDYGCSGSSRAKVSVRRCYASNPWGSTIDVLGYV